MQLEIVSPERVLLKSEVKSVTAPGVDGKFQILDNHAPIVATLVEGRIIFNTEEELSEDFRKNFIEGKDASELSLKIIGGVLEMNDNKVIILVD